MINAYRISIGKCERKHHFDADVDGRVTLNWIKIEDHRIV